MNVASIDGGFYDQVRSDVYNAHEINSFDPYIITPKNSFNVEVPNDFKSLNFQIFKSLNYLCGIIVNNAIDAAILESQTSVQTFAFYGSASFENPSLNYKLSCSHHFNNYNKHSYISAGKL